MTTTKAITQPCGQTTLDAIDGALSMPGLERIDIAAAYITPSGLRLLLEKMKVRGCADDIQVAKRWITSFDYLRTDPVALKTLLQLPNSSVKIHEAQVCLEHRGVPRVPFHPKAFLIRGNQIDHALTGSGNISRSGLSRGFEAGLIIGADKGAKPENCQVRAAINSLSSYFETIWKGANSLTQPLLNRYETLFETEDHLQNPTPTEDDIAPSETSRGTLSSDDLKKLRVCRHFWIEAGNVTRNRGRNLPGNQLMMKRLSRVFFGFEPIAVSENSSIGTINIHYGKSVRDDCSLTYSDNKMDKLVLPIPGDGGPESYDNKTLKFERIGPASFRLTIGTPSEIKTWKKNSERINASFAMSGGRLWGVF